MQTYYVVYSKMSHAVYGFNQTINTLNHCIKKIDRKHFEIIIEDKKLKFCSDGLWQTAFKHGSHTKPINGYYLERKLDEINIINPQRKR